MGLICSTSVLCCIFSFLTTTKLCGSLSGASCWPSEYQAHVSLLNNDNHRWDPTCGMPRCLPHLWVSDWLCVSTSVLLGSGYRDEAARWNGLRRLAGRSDPDRSTSITAWNLNVKHAPPLKPFVILCGSAGLDTQTELTCGQTRTNILRHRPH